MEARDEEVVDVAAEHTADQIAWVQRDYAANFIMFMDSLLNGVPKRLVELCELLLSRSIKVEWASFMRAKMDPETAKLLKRAGCHHVFIGVESFSDETLELMRKRRTRADNLQAVEAFLGARYHLPSDDVAQAIDWQGAGRLAQVSTLLARAAGDADARPSWNPGDFFGRTFGPGGAATGR